MRFISEWVRLRTAFGSPVQAVNASNHPVNRHELRSEVNYGEVAKIILVAGCNCIFYSALRGANF